MILEQDAKERYKQYRDLSRSCEISRRERKANAARQRTTYLTGTTYGGTALYNRIREFVQWGSAQMFQAQAARFGIQLPEHYGDVFTEEQEAARLHLTKRWKTGPGRPALVANTAVEWAFVHDSVVLKVVAENNQPVLYMVPDPGDIGVLREGLNSLNSQEAICHYYELDLAAYDRLIAYLPTEQRYRLRVLAAEHAAPAKSQVDLLPPAVASIILTGVNGSMPTHGNVLGLPNLLAGVAREREPVARLAELWVRDDAEDGSRPTHWRKVLIHMPTLEVIFDTPMDRVYGDRHCFHLLSLAEIPGYLWGLSLLDSLVELQNWREKRMAGIDKREQLQLEPPLFFSGVSGLTDDQADRFRAPGGWWSSTIPNASVTPVVPPLPPDAFALVAEIDKMFDRMAGMSPSAAGQGQPNVRSGEQEFALAALGSPRMANMVARVESVIGDVVTQMLHMMQRTTGTALRKASGEKFFLSQVPREITASVVARSASPLYEDQMLMRSALSFKAGVVDAEDFVEMLGLPNDDVLRAKARKRMAGQSEAAKKQMELEAAEIEAKVKKNEAMAQKALRP
jgi:hypothetical protein